MVDGGGGTSFPVVFYDGEREINIGDICVHPMLQFKVFQKMISDRIGISPNQISIYIVPHSSSPEERRRVPITGKVNFSLIIRQKDCFFLVILKRSRKSRYQRLRPAGMDYGDFVPDGEFLPAPPLLDNLVILRRNQPELDLMGLPMDGYAKSFHEPMAQLELSGLNDRLQNLKLQREMYGMAMKQPVCFNGPSPDLGPNLDPYPFPMIDETMTKNVKETDSNRVVCEECVSTAGGGGRGDAAPFHACVKDTPIKRFRTRAGPIAKPVKPCR